MVSKSTSQRRILLVGSVAIVISVLVNIGISLVAKNVLQLSPAFAPLGIGPVIFWSLFFGIGALLVFLAFKRWSSRPLPAYIILSIIVYLLTFLPDAWVASNSIFPGTSGEAVLTLMAMHAAEAIILLATLAISEMRHK